MQDQDSVKNELQTLIMLEQQQASALHSINSKAGLGGAPMGGGSQFGFSGTGLYGPISYGGLGSNDISSVGFYKAGGDLYDRAVSGVINSVNNINANMRNFAMTANLDSASPVWSNQSKLSAEARQLQVSRGGEKLASGTMSAVSGAVGIGTNLLASGITGALGGAAIGAVVDIGADQLKQNYAYDQYLTQNSYRFINMMESNNKRGVAGFNRSERWETANFLRHFNTEMKISDEDTMTILKGFTEGDLLRESKDVETFKDQMTKLTKSLKTMALTLNDSYEEVAELMATMKKKGIDTRNYEVYAAQSKIVGGLIGADASETMQYQLDTASSLTAGTMMSTDKMMNTVSSAQAYIGKMYDEALANKDVNQDAALRYNRIVNRGGVDAATSDYLSSTSGILRNNSMMQYYGAAFFDWDGENWTFNRGKFDEFTSGNYTIHDVVNDTKVKLNSSGSAGKMAWQNRGAELLENSMTNVSDRASLIKGLVDATRLAIPGMSGMADAEVLKILDSTLSSTDSIFISDITGYVANDGGKYYDKVISASIAQKYMDELNSNRVGAGYYMKNWWGRKKDAIGDVFSPLGQGWNWVTEKTQDWWYGKEYYDVKKMWSETDFTKIGGNFNYDSMLQSIDDAISAFGEESKGTAESLKSLRASIDNMRQSVDNTANSMSNDTFGTKAINPGKLTSFKDYKGDFSVWTSRYGVQGHFATEALDYWNQYLDLNKTPGASGFYSEADMEAILKAAGAKYTDFMMNKGELSQGEYWFAKSYEEYNQNVAMQPGFKDAYNAAFIGAKGKKLPFDVNTPLSDKSAKLSEIYDYDAEIEDLLAQRDEALVEIQKDPDGNGWYFDKGFVKTRYKKGDVDAINDRLATLYEMKKSIDPLKEEYESVSTALPTFASMIGVDKDTVRQFRNLFEKDPDNYIMHAENIKEALATRMFSELDGQYSDGATIGSLQSMKQEFIDRWAEPVGGTQVIETAFDNWLNDNEDIKNGGVLTQDAKKDLVGYIINAGLNGGDITSSQNQARDDEQAKDIRGIYDILYGKYVADKDDDPDTNSTEIFNEVTVDRNNRARAYDPGTNPSSPAAQGGSGGGAG